jgi:hypothetical protein
MAAKTIELIFSKGKKGNAFHLRRTLPFSLCCDYISPESPSSYCFPVPIYDTFPCFYYTLIVLYVSSFIIQDRNYDAEDSGLI